MNIGKNKSVGFLIGAGAVKNAWRPIIKAIQPDYFKEELTIEGATSSLARLIYLMRWYSLNANETTVEYKQILQNTKQRICQEIEISNQKGEITVQDQFPKIVDQIILANCKRLMIVSTNWDTVIEDAINEICAIKRLFNNQRLYPAHIHGIYTDPNSVYLPTEVAEEPYRTNIEKQILGVMHLSVMKTMKEADSLIIYGLSVSPLDAELTQILGTSISRSKVKSIHIINPDHELVAERINLLIEYPADITVFGYSPDTLDNPIDYTLR